MNWKLPFRPYVILYNRPIGEQTESFARVHDIICVRVSLVFVSTVIVVQVKRESVQQTPADLNDKRQKTV